jgi:glyoxylase-like metal-dependent hydrolase (beta-lactamase superfamily II)
MSTPPPYAVYAIRYATVVKRASENFIGGDPHDGPMPMDYFVWLATGEAGTFVIDTGFGAAAAAARKRTLLRTPAEGLRALGIAAEQVNEVVITHLHYDHAGCLPAFPRATFHLQEDELAYATGALMRHAALRGAFAVEDVVETVRALYSDRVRLHRGDRELAPGLSLHRIGGHTKGLQVVRLWTARGWLVLASDASHYYANMEEGRPFPIVLDVGAMLDGHERLRELAQSPAHIIPGHDPAVMQRYPAAGAGLGGIAVRLDVDPIGG